MAAVFYRHMGGLVSSLGQMPAVAIPFPPSGHSMAIQKWLMFQYSNSEIEHSKPCVTKQIADIKYQCANAAHKHLSLTICQALGNFLESNYL